MWGLDLPFWILKYQSFKHSSGSQGGGINSEVSPEKNYFFTPLVKIWVNSAITHTQRT